MAIRMSNIHQLGLLIVFDAGLLTSLVNCRPSEWIGAKLRLPFVFMIHFPCCHCMIPLGQLGSVGLATAPRNK
jgi:hypothetical protein